MDNNEHPMSAGRDSRSLAVRLSAVDARSKQVAHTGAVSDVSHHVITNTLHKTLPQGHMDNMM